MNILSLFILYVNLFLVLGTRDKHKKELYNIVLSDTTTSIYEKRLYIAQARLETGNFNKVKHNNVYGIMFRGRLKRFKSINACYIYRKRLNGKTTLIRKSYAKDKRYRHKIFVIMRSVKIDTLLAHKERGCGDTTLINLTNNQ